MKTYLLHRWFINRLTALTRRRPLAQRAPAVERGDPGTPLAGRWRRQWRELIRFLQFGLTLITAPGFAAPAEIYVFGDSAVDMGNYHALPDFAPGPNAVYYTGPDGFTRLCDGPMWPERLYPGLRVWSDPQRTGNRVNFAYGDAKTDLGSQTFGDDLPIGVQSQLDWFASEVAVGRLRVTPQSAFFVEAGPNDYFAGVDLGMDPAIVSERVAGNLAGAVHRLAQLGGRTVFVHDIPDFGDAPAFHEIPGLTPEQGAMARQALNAMAADGRTQLREALTSARQQLGPDVNIVTLPINELFTAIRANPAAFGFTNITGKIYDSETDTVLVTDPAERARYLFVDFLHLSAAGQEWESRYYRAVIDAIEGGPQRHVARVADAALGSAERWQRAVIDAGTASRAPQAADSRWRAFIVANAEGSEGDAAKMEPAWRADSGGLLAGIGTSTGTGWTTGLALTTQGQRGHTDGRALRFEFTSVGGWMFGARQLGKFTLRGAAGVQRFDYRLERDPRIPTMLARAEPNGSLAALRLEIDRRVQRGRFAGAFFGQVEASRFELDGFSERGAPGLDLRFARMRRDSGSVALGFRSAITPIAIGALRLEPLLWLQCGYAFGNCFTEVEATLINNTANPTTGRVASGAPWQVWSGFGVAATLGRHRLELGCDGMRGSQSVSMNVARITYRCAF